MDKEVLCIIDTRQIQRFAFRSNSYLNTLGGSDIMTHVLADALIYALNHADVGLSEDEYDMSQDPEADVPFLTSQKIKFQLIVNTAGNALFLARTGALCQKIIRKISRYYLGHTCSLNLACAVVEKTQNCRDDMSCLYNVLNTNKNAAEMVNPLGALAVVQQEERTGEPLSCHDEKTGELISETSRLKRMEGRKHENIVNVDELFPTASRNQEFLAVVHADGNNMGLIVGNLIQSTTSYEKPLKTEER